MKQFFKTLIRQVIENHKPAPEVVLNESDFAVPHYVLSCQGCDYSYEEETNKFDAHLWERAREAIAAHRQEELAEVLNEWFKMMLGEHEELNQKRVEDF